MKWITLGSNPSIQGATPCEPAMQIDIIMIPEKPLTPREEFGIKLKLGIASTEDLVEALAREIDEEILAEIEAKKVVDHGQRQRP